MIELRPCPFCGGRAELNEHTGYGWRTVQCVECCASTSEAGVYTAAEAAARWNRRAADQPAAAEFDPQPTVLTDDECEYIIGFMGVREWEGLTRDDVRLWAKALDELPYLRAADSAAAQPAAAREHTTSEDCWCNPTLDYVDPDTGAAVYVHHELI